MVAKVILNPYAGRWQALYRREEMVSALKACGIDFELVATASPGQGIELAAQAVREGFNPIISAGGDGSNSEVVNGIAQAMREAPEEETWPAFGVMPLGTANDLVDNLSMPKELDKAAGVIAAGVTRMMDLCQVNGRFFDNNAAIGLEPYVTLIQQRITRLRGTLRYLVATLRAVGDNPQWSMHLEWQGGQFDGPITLVTVGNNPRTGGIFFVTPHASPFDGLLTFVYGFMPTRLQILRLLPRTMKPGAGNYVEHPAIHEVNSPWLRVHSENPTPSHADGEIQSEAIQDLEYRVIPARLPVLMG